MKKQYSPMSVDVVRFEAEDVITVSQLSAAPSVPPTDQGYISNLPTEPAHNSNPPTTSASPTPEP